jgi:hypothetical protein
MARKSKTRQLLETNLGQHVALVVAAHLARTQLVPEPPAPPDVQSVHDILNRVGGALARVAPLYEHDGKNAEPRELTRAELEGAAVRHGATAVLLRDGRRLSSVTMKRADLRQAIAILKSVGVLSVVPPRPEAAAQPRPAAPDRLGELIARLMELEHLLRPPCAPAELEKADRLAVSIARRAPHGRISNRAMQLISALHESGGGGRVAAPIALALAQLRLALEETQPGRES